MEVDAEQFNRKKRLGRVNRNLDTGIDEHEEKDSSEESELSSVSGQESPRRRAGQDSTRRREVVKRDAQDRKEQQ